MTAIRLGANAFGREETVVNYDSSVGIAHVATVMAAIGTFKATVELTVSERDSSTSIYDGHETAVSGIAIYTALNGD